MRKNRLAYTILSLLVTIVLMGLLFSRIRAGEFIQTLRNIHLPFVLIFIAIAVFNMCLRAWRYKWILEPNPISFKNILYVTLIRNVFVDFLPARLGSLSYIYVLNKRLGFSFETAASSFVVTFIFDFLTLSPFLIAAIFAVGLGTTQISTLALLLVSALFFFMIFLVMWKLEMLGSWLLRICQSLLKKFRLTDRHWTSVLVQKWHSTLADLERIRKRGIYWRLFGLSVLIRSAKYGALYFLLASLLKSHGIRTAQLSLWKTILGITGAEMTAMFPIKGLGGFGTWESAWALTFQMMNFDANLAILSGLGVHLITNLFEYTLGIAAILILVWPYLKKKTSKIKE
ncbi:lysylphosphatidylglycerol synthase transmembrane domain-containing protein [Acidobacteriota bacterium]